MNKRINIIFTSAFLVFFIIFLVIVKTNKPRILIVHSYALDFNWVREINDGFAKVLEGKPYSVKYHYMDTKRNPEPEYKERAGMLARKIIDSWKPELLITVDDNAQKYVGQYYVNDTKMNIVFAGVNGSAEDYNYSDAKNVTGILERIPFESFKEVFMKILPSDQRKIIHLSDASPSSKLLAVELNDYDWEPLELIKSVQIDSFEVWKKTARQCNDIADVLLISHYHTLKPKSGKQRVVPPAVVIAWTEANTDLPNIGCWSFFVQDGGMMAIAISGNEQGEVAAEMAVEIIEKKIKPSDIPVTKTKNYVICLKESELKEKNIAVPEIYQMFARATNNYFE